MTESPASVIVAGTLDRPGAVRTVLSLLRQTVATDVIAIGERAAEREIRDVLAGILPPTLVLLPPGAGGEASMAAAVAAARSDCLVFAEAGAVYHPRYVELVLAAHSPGFSAGACGGALPGRPAAPPDDRRPLDGVVDLLTGRLDARTLHCPRSMLAGSPPESFASLLELSLHVATVAGVGGIGLPPAALPADGADAGAEDAAAADWFSRYADAVAFGPRALHALATAAPTARPRLSALAEQRLSDVVGGASVTLAYAGLHRRLIARRLSARPGYSPEVAVRRGNPLAALAAMTRAAPRTEYAMLCHRRAQPEVLAAMIRSAEVGGLVACLPVTDDGLYHPPDNRETVVGVVFRTAALAAVFATGEIRDERRFWFLMARQGAVGGLLSGVPGVSLLPKRSLIRLGGARVRSRAAPLVRGSVWLVRGVARRSRRLARRLLVKAKLV
jgi:hypothetical protein